MSANLHLRVPNRIEELPGVSEAVEALGREEGWTQDVTYAIVLGLEEVATNVVRHGGSEPGSSEIEIEVTSSDDEVRIEVRDSGKAFDPFHEAPEPDLDAEVQDRQIGGLGVHFVKVLMDETSYSREGGRNHVSMVKRRS
ncbi:MAG: ATP-binding protein [Acidobacteria bacterium]|nr:ATP-binding protein [Acidobacteriota bacterium]